MDSAGFHVLIFFEAKPDKAEKLEQLLKDLVEPSKAEAGCHY
jgi:quinol monooxygenase YgiN